MNNLTQKENLTENRPFNNHLRNIERLIDYQNKRLAHGLELVTWPRAMAGEALTTFQELMSALDSCDPVA